MFRLCISKQTETYWTYVKAGKFCEQLVSFVSKIRSLIFHEFDTFFFFLYATSVLINDNFTTFYLIL